ncbi:MAG: VOC family protein [Micromonosporaceae bacterium]
MSVQDCTIPAKTEPASNDDVPAGYSRVDPWVISSDTDSEITFLGQVFGATERPNSRMLNADGTIGHVEVDLAGSVIMMFDAQPGWPAMPAHLRAYVDDVDAAFDRAIAAGASPVTRPTTSHSLNESPDSATHKATCGGCTSAPRHSPSTRWAAGSRTPPTNKQ